MNSSARSIVRLCAAAATALAIGLAGGVSAHSHGEKGEAAHHGKTAMPAGLAVEKAWARASAGKAANGGAYVTILNGGKEGDRLVAAESGVAKKVEIHTHRNDNGIMRMTRVDGIEIAAGSVVTMRPGGYHVMLMGLNNPLKQGEKFSLTLVFEKAGKKTVDVAVMGVGTMSPETAPGHMNMPGHAPGGMPGQKH